MKVRSNGVVITEANSPAFSPNEGFKTNAVLVQSQSKGVNKIVIEGKKQAKDISQVGMISASHADSVRHFNTRIIRDDAHLLPRVDDLFDSIGNAKYFTTLDVISGYWQIPVHPDDRLTPSFTILTRLDGEVLARVTERWPGTTTGLTVTWTRVKIHASGILSRPPPQG